MENNGSAMAGEMTDERHAPSSEPVPADAPASAPATTPAPAQTPASPPTPARATPSGSSAHHSFEETIEEAKRAHWRIGPILPERLRRQRRPRLWQEIAFIALSYWVYSLIRNAVPTHVKPALEHARSVLDLEKTLNIDVELTLNRFVDAVHWGGWHWLANISNYYYAVMHFIIVITVLVWVYVRHPMNYRSVRTALYAANGLAAIGFWLYPLAPPRLMGTPHFIDTVVKYHTWGSWGSGDVAKYSNQFAAMPSLHIGWSLWCGITIFMLTSKWWLRALGLAYPAVTFFVIIGTANHFVLDALGDVVVLTLGFLIQRLLTGRAAYSPLVTDATGGRSPDSSARGRQPPGP